jgi:hypothetical protein
MSKTKIINFVVAQKHEALPIIDYFELTLNEKRYRNIFSNAEKNVFLIISGIGIQNAKKAVVKLKQLNNNKDDIWVNIGIAGHETFKVGSIYEVKKVISRNNENTFFTNSFYNEVPTGTICCVNEEEKEYNNKYLYDMESYGFLEALDSLTIKENIFVFKIVSDNLQFKPKSYKNFAISFISKHISKIDNILDQYRNKPLESFYGTTLMLNIIKNKYHVTFYNKRKLEKILTKIFVIKSHKQIENEILISKSLNSLIKKFESYLTKYILKI